MDDTRSDAPAPSDESSSPRPRTVPVESAEEMHEPALATSSAQALEDVRMLEVGKAIYSQIGLDAAPFAKVGLEGLGERITSPKGFKEDEKPQHGSLATSYSSFGDEGTTASVNSHGQLMQITTV
ncbi:hypothetical protein MPH_01736 [Macrophomina phaseolina MS6]|uniref:Uncharacterized protein n=1 Tax=Macrophomina phaseolina (strain MS6) TaxID=1126212 RepID=K2S7I6_MACPH|nr:hypothetical protein MPH_01736 [Macrophomina phaseolina MS6]